MRSLPTLIRLSRWELDQKRRKLGELERLRVDFETQSERLEAELRGEQKSATLSDEGRYAYPAYADAVIDRRRTLARSIAEVEASIEAAREELTTAFEKVKTYELAEERRQDRARATAQRRERLELDEIGLEMYRRRPGQSA